VLRNDAEGRTLQTFVRGSDGRLFGLVAKGYYDGAKHADGGEIHVLDATGEKSSVWSTSFTPQRLAAGSDGTLFVAGFGRLAQFTAEGKLLREAAAPHLATVMADKDSLRKAAEAQRGEQVEQYESQLRQYEDLLKDAEKKQADAKPAAEKKPATDAVVAEEPAPQSSSGVSLFGITLFGGSETKYARAAPESNVESYRSMRDALKQMHDEQKAKPLEDIEREIAAQLERVHGIAVSADHVYVATAMSKGYGYAVWRMTHEFTEPKQIVSGLSGCCGQIDIQCHGDELFVAENSRHRVVRYDRDGKRTSAWGKRDRDGAGGGFGSCCNPMNLCFLSDGTVVTSESEGLMKRFSPDGKYDGMLASAKVGGGCKNVAVAVSTDGRHAYFYDQTGSQILVFEQADAAKAPN